ncbi:hypothetical protein GGE46_003669 [Rhizobium etli]|uniref:Uncharacterized protein n=1 Tax=Rhizobium etli TaxID=29449 RepID=A0A7W6ZIZ8_RHIET|nr:hypothetical protein [Rhizobium etli]MBB4536670.1 hypothetical protein [Rhizobium etli]
MAKRLDSAGLKLGWAGVPQPFESGTVLMLRGLGDDAPHFPAMLSPMADF